MYSNSGCACVFSSDSCVALESYTWVVFNETINAMEREGRLHMRIDNSFLAANRIGPSLEHKLINKVKDEDEAEKKGIAGGFEKIFDDLWKASSELSAESRAETAKLIIGELDDLPGMQVKGEKSSIMFEYNLNVRAKVIDAYNEIMRTSI